ncbi:MAG TPA: YciI family protein [Chitinophagaceae bacterium]|nr:YciI family protein [Chitinophagaceae bacterium]
MYTQASRSIFLIAGILAITLAGRTQPPGGGEKPEARIRQYWFVMLTAGPNRNQDSATAASIQQGHLANITRLYQEGKLKVAGPFGDDGNWKGLFIFDCPSRQEVEQLLRTDPAIAAGRLTFEIHPWWTMPTGSFVPGKPGQPLH